MVQFRSQQNRTFLFKILIGFIPGIVMAFIISRVLGERNWATVGLAFLGIQAFFLANWLVESVVGWVPFLLGGRKALAKTLLIDLRERAFPDPNDYEDSVEGYLAHVIEDTSLTPDVRMSASATLNSFHTLRSAGQMLPLMSLSFAMEDALTELKADKAKGKSAASS